MMITATPRPSLARRAQEDLPNFLALAAFVGITALAFRSWEFALMVTASLGFHEIGHAAALSLSGLRWRISFNILGAFTWSSLPERERLSDLRNTFIHLAGPFFSLLLALLSLLLAQFWNPAGEHLLLLANFSAQVGLFNLLPLGGLTDGGKVVRRLAGSHLRGAARAWAMWLPILVSGLILTGYLLTQARGGEAGAIMLSLLLLGVWMSGSLLLELRLPRGPAIPVTGAAHPPQPSARITAAQGGLVVALMFGLLILALVVSAATPFWLAPRYVLGGLLNFANIMLILSGRGAL
jgi:hypothetical protein